MSRISPALIEVLKAGTPAFPHSAIYLHTDTFTRLRDELKASMSNDTNNLTPDIAHNPWEPQWSNDAIWQLIGFPLVKCDDLAVGSFELRTIGSDVAVTRGTVFAPDDAVVQ